MKASQAAENHVCSCFVEVIKMDPSVFTV